MLRTRSRKIFRDVTASKLRTALVAINIFIGVLGVVTLVTASDLIVSQLHEDIRTDELAMADIYVSLLDDAEVDDAALLSDLRAYPGVTVASAQIVERLFWKKTGDEGFIISDVRSYADPLDALAVEPTQLLEGEYPGENQLAVERRTAIRYDLKVGDEIVIRDLRNLDERTDPTAPIPEETWTISAILFHAYQYETTTFYTPYENLERISDARGFTRFSARFTDFPTAQQEYDAFLATFDDTAYDVRADFLNNPEEDDFLNDIEQWAMTLTALSVIATLVSGFLVFTVISTLVVEQRRQIGVMKSLGATQTDNIGIYIGISFLYGMLGMIPGVLLGIVAGYYLVEDVLASQVGIVVDQFEISTTGVIAGVVLGTLTPVLAAVLPVYLGTRVSILSAMTDLGIASNYGKGSLSRLIRVLPLPVVVRQALANISQRMGRLALTGFTLTLAVGAFMGVTAVFASLNKQTDQIFETFNYEYQVSPEDDEAVPEVMALLAEQGSVQPVEFQNLSLLLENGDTITDIRASGSDVASRIINPTLTEGGSWEDHPEGAVITQTMAENNGLGLGDTLTLLNENTDRTLEIEIVGISSFPNQRAFLPIDPLLSLQTERRYPNAIAVQSGDMTSGEVDEEIGEVREALLRNGILASFYNQVADKEANTELIFTVGVVFNIVSAVMASVGAVGLLTMLSISVFERQREIGVMRSVGASSSAIAAQFLVEGLTIGTIAWVLGVPVSYGLSLILVDVLPIGRFDFNYPLLILLVGLVGMMVIATVAALWPSLSAARKTVSDILRYQ